MKNLLYIQAIYSLFETVQKAQIFEDQKSMTDAIPLFPISEIMERFENKKEFSKEELKTFILENFELNNTTKNDLIIRDKILPIAEHIEKLWDILTRTSTQHKGSLLQLPFPYIVPGGRFEEFFYWDSYYIMLGLQASARLQMMENIVANCAYLIETYGFVPNANRTYFLSRSQPPYLSLMLDLLYETTKDKYIYIKYFGAMQKEYNFWMDGLENLQIQSSYRHVIKTINGDILNRYFDEENQPRPESFMIDIEDFSKSKNKEFYRNIRSACESGWDFSSRWFQNSNQISSIQTLDIAPVDLNCLLWHLESTLNNTATYLGLSSLSTLYLNKAITRKKMIQQYFWDSKAGLYKDYLFLEDKWTKSENITTVYPPFMGLTTKKQTEAIAKNINKKFLKEGGLITTTINSGQQWDAPNAWAPYQWLGYKAMKNYGLEEIASNIKNNWCNNVERVYLNTNKLMEKYNAINIHSTAGGGEYPNQDGFGWTNGVYLKLKQS